MSSKTVPHVPAADGRPPMDVPGQRWQDAVRSGLCRLDTRTAWVRLVVQTSGRTSHGAPWSAPALARVVGGRTQPQSSLSPRNGAPARASGPPEDPKG